MSVETLKFYFGKVPLEPCINSTSQICPVDLAAEDGDITGVSDWHNGSIELSFEIRDEDNHIGKWFNGIMMDFKRKKKAMSYAVTHGYTIRIICDVDGDEGYFEIDKPRDVNLLFRTVPFVPRMKIVKDGCFYNIRKGRIVPFRVWPVTEQKINMYEKKCNQGKIL